MSKVGFAFGTKNKKRKLVTSSAKITGFSVSSSSDGNQKQFVTGFQEGKLLPLHGQAPDPEELVIPLIKQNNWNADKQEKKEGTDSKKQDTTAPKPLTEQEQVADIILSELNHDRASKQSRDETLVIPMSEAEEKRKQDLFGHHKSKGADVAAPILASNQIPGLESLTSESEKFHHDVSLRPEALSVKGEGYVQVPVEAFGLAMLRGMGWSETPESVDEKKRFEAEIQPRHYRLGLGAAPKPPSPESSKGKGKKKHSHRSKHSKRHHTSSSSSRRRSRSHSRHRSS